MSLASRTLLATGNHTIEAKDCLRATGIAFCLLLAAGCARDLPPRNSAMQPQLPRSHRQLAGGMALFAATVVEGGGVRTANRKQPQVVVDVSREFPGQLRPPGRVKLGQQTAAFQIIGSTERESEADFEIPPNGTRIIAFGEPGGKGLVVYANLVFADTDANQAAVLAGRGPAAGAAYEGPLFLGALGFAFAAIFVGWLRVRYGVIALAVSIGCWLGYETTVSSQAIRVDLLILLPLVAAATISVGVAAARGGKNPERNTRRRRRALRRDKE